MQNTAVETVADHQEAAPFSGTNRPRWGRDWNTVSSILPFTPMADVRLFQIQCVFDELGAVARVSEFEPDFARTPPPFWSQCGQTNRRTRRCRYGMTSSENHGFFASQRLFRGLGWGSGKHSGV